MTAQQIISELRLRGIEASETEKSNVFELTVDSIPISINFYLSLVYLERSFITTNARLDFLVDQTLLTEASVEIQLINCEINFGNFDLSWDTRRIYFRTGWDFHASELQMQMIHHSVSSTIAATNLFIERLRQFSRKSNSSFVEL